MAQRAGDFASEADHPDRAKKAYQLALEHWKALDKPEQVEEVKSKIGVSPE